MKSSAIYMNHFQCDREIENTNITCLTLRFSLCLHEHASESTSSTVFVL